LLYSGLEGAKLFRSI